MRAVVVALLVLTACGDGTSTSQTPEKFQQTWPKNYGETTCSEWNGAMTAPQKFAASADMLVGARSQDGGKQLPADALISTFENDITLGCSEIGSLDIAEVAAATYVIGRTQYGP